MGNGSADTWRRRTATAVALLFPVVAGGVTWAASATFEGAHVVDRPSARWQTIEYEGLRVDIPSAWHRADLSECGERDIEHWTASADDACGDGPGVFFLADATFCPAHGPDIRQDRGAGPLRWSGYRRVGETVVSVTAAHRDVARQVLRSVDRSVERDEAPAEHSYR